jgi:RNA-splicing ligase RtcB
MSEASKTIASLHTCLAMPMDAPAKQAIERVRRADDVAHVAVMPDVHLAGDVCVGTAMATRRLVYPSAVGGDIGCGMLAVAFDAPADILREAQNAGALLRRLGERIPPSAGIDYEPCRCRRVSRREIFPIRHCDHCSKAMGSSNSGRWAAEIISSRCRRTKPANSGS